MKAPTPEAVSAFVVMLIGVLDPFLFRVGDLMTTYWHIIFPPDYVGGRLTPFLTTVFTYFVVRKARQWHEESK